MVHRGLPGLSLPHGDGLEVILHGVGQGGAVLLVYEDLGGGQAVVAVLPLGLKEERRNGCEVDWLGLEIALLMNTNLSGKYTI